MREPLLVGRFVNLYLCTHNGQFFHILSEELDLISCKAKIIHKLVGTGIILECYLDFETESDELVFKLSHPDINVLADRLQRITFEQSV